ncbi:MAG: aldo/keto reductase [Candidatus Latescibacter sp.]|nr:aldo/keto reductase [Candidatus Latescibacter sp.]
MQHSSRREFLKKTAVTGLIAGAGLSASGLFPRRIFAQDKKQDGKPTLRKLGSTGLEVSEVGFGVMNTRDPELVKAGLDAGINYFDTAHGYMNGVNEQVLGEVLKQAGRNKVLVATKVHCKGRSADDVRQMMELSLKRLQTDHVEIMFMHMPQNSSEIMIEEHMKVFEKAKKDGLCRFIGVSTHTNHADTIATAVNSKFWEAVTVGYNHQSPDEVTAAIEKARKAGLAIIAMKTQVKGKGYPDHKMGDISSQQAALKWVLQNKYVDTTIPGVRNFEEIAENVAVMGMKMSFFDRRTLYKHAENLKGAYCRGAAGCTGCQDQCPKGVEICELNRCLGYAYGYEDLRLAKENYAQLPPASRVERCSDCGECVVKCVSGLDLTDSVRRARKLFA